MCRTTIADLPIPVLHKLFKILGQEGVIELGKTCAFMRTLVAETVPNLSLTLYPHQVSCGSFTFDAASAITTAKNTHPSS